MHPREVPKQVQSRRKAQPGWGPGEALRQRVGLFWGLTRRAGVPKDAGGCCTTCQGTSLGLRDAPTPAPLATPARAHWIASHALSCQCPFGGARRLPAVVQ